MVNGKTMDGMRDWQTKSLMKDKNSKIWAIMMSIGVVIIQANAKR